MTGKLHEHEPEIHYGIFVYCGAWENWRGYTNLNQDDWQFLGEAPSAQAAWNERLEHQSRGTPCLIDRYTS